MQGQILCKCRITTNSYCLPQSKLCLPVNLSIQFRDLSFPVLKLILIPEQTSAGAPLLSHQYYISSIAHYAPLYSRGLMSLSNMEMIRNCNGDSPGPPQYFNVAVTGSGCMKEVEQHLKIICFSLSVKDQERSYPIPTAFRWLLRPQ